MYIHIVRACACARARVCHIHTEAHTFSPSGWLNHQVETQSISPLLWAVESGTWKAAELIIEDLLTIRADREEYYYGLDDLFL